MTNKEYLKNREKYIKRATESYSKTFNSPKERLKRMLVEAKCRAKSRNLDFSICIEDVKWNNVCPVFGLQIEFRRRKGRGGDDNSPSLDRIDNSKGYIKGNVRLVSNKANKLKNRMTKEECRLLWEKWDCI